MLLAFRSQRKGVFRLALLACTVSVLVGWSNSSEERVATTPIPTSPSPSTEPTLESGSDDQATLTLEPLPLDLTADKKADGSFLTRLVLAFVIVTIIIGLLFIFVGLFFPGLIPRQKTKAQFRDTSQPRQNPVPTTRNHAQPRVASTGSVAGTGTRAGVGAVKRTSFPDVPRESIKTVALPVDAPVSDDVKNEEPLARVRPNLAPVGASDAEATPNIFNEVSDRSIIKPPQIGDPSSFAKKNWWDPKVEWCQLSPLGMTGDITCDIGTFGSSAVAAVSLRGNKHKVDAKPCQDAFNVQSANDKSGAKYVVSVLCDGMSSARYSHYGARRTSQVLSDELCRMIENLETVDINFVNANIESVLEFCRQKVIPTEIDLFGASGIDPTDAVDSDFNTTVTFLIAPSTAGEMNSKAIVGCIGDSPVFVLHSPEGMWEQIGVIDSADELVNPATAAFPGSIAIAIDELDIRKDDVLVAMSDGVGNFINVRGNQTTLGTYLAKQWSTPVNMATFINDVSFDMKSADDDRTVVAIWQRM
jgi:hypothetical protein